MRNSEKDQKILNLNNIWDSDDDEDENNK